jgi:hypothetical protein
MPNTTHISAAEVERDQGSTLGLLSRLLTDFTSLFRNEFALARAEVMHAADNLKAAAGAIAVAGAVGLTGVLCLTAAAVLGLAEVLPPWGAALLVGLLLLVIGAVLLKKAQSRLEHPATKLERTQTSLKQDAALAARSTS